MHVIYRVQFSYLWFEREIVIERPLRTINPFVTPWIAKTATVCTYKVQDLLIKSLIQKRVISLSVLGLKDIQVSKDILYKS